MKTPSGRTDPREDEPRRLLPTEAIHGGGTARRPGEPVVPPIVQTSTFHGGGPDDEGPLRYTRYGTNPNQIRVGDLIARMEGMEAGLALGSGMAAISLTCLSLSSVGDHAVCSARLYGTTTSFMAEELARRGVEVTFVEPTVPGAWAEALRPRTRFLYLEVPTNPTMRIVDVRAAAEAARSAGAPLVVDSTLASPVNLRPGDFGAEIVIHSATKYLGGHSDLIAGVVTGPAARIEAVRRMLYLYGPSLDPHAAWLLARGLATLDVRVERHNSNALALARWFEAHPRVERVVYPGLESHVDHALACELMDGFGGMLGIVLPGGAEAADAFCRALRVGIVAPSLGGVETLVSLPRLTSHISLSPAQRAEAGIPDGFVRISVGIEGLEDLKADFEQALARCQVTR